MTSGFVRVAVAAALTFVPSTTYGQASGSAAPNDDAEDALSPATNEELFEEPGALREGTNVYLEDMVVRAKSGLVLRASDGKHQIYIAPDDPSSLDFIAIGAHIDVRGTLVVAPSARQAQLVFAMGASEARRLARKKVYVDAWYVTARR